MSSVSGLNSLLSSLSSGSGIDLSSLLQAASGASAAGIDVTSAVNAAVTAARAPEQNWESQESILQSQTTGLKQLQTEISNLDNDIQSLNSLAGPLASRTVTSSNSSVVSASATPGTAAGNHTVVVNSLATTDSWASNTVASASTLLPSGSFTITGADGTTTTISTGTGGSTLTDVAQQINADNLGLTASVVTDATGARLAIVSNISGTAANFSIQPPSGGPLQFSEAVAGGNASLSVDGISISSASNTVTGVLPGVTLNLLNANPGTNVSLSVTPDTSQVSAALNQFVTDYNTAIKDINAQFTDTGSGEGVLATDSSVRNLQAQLMSALNYTYTPASGTTTVSGLSSLGISVQNDGTLTVDSSTLNSALQNNLSDVQTFFQGSAMNGFANSLDQQLTSFISPADGAFTLDLQSLGKQITDFQTDISNYETNYITPLKSQLQAEYSQAEILLQQLPTEMKQISEEMGQNSSGN